MSVEYNAAKEGGAHEDDSTYFTYFAFCSWSPGILWGHISPLPPTEMQGKGLLSGQAMVPFCDLDKSYTPACIPHCKTDESHVPH